MTTEAPITVGIFDGFSWIRCDGKGSFLNSPAMKAFGEERIAAGERCLVVDLEQCSGMDSTFMGTLAGMAARLAAHPGGVVQVADVGERNRRSLEDLGLDFLLEIDPAAAPWRPIADRIRSALRPPGESTRPSQLERSLHVLEAHQTLADTNEKNARTFSNVVSMLESEVAEKQKLADGRTNR